MPRVKFILDKTKFLFLKSTTPVHPYRPFAFESTDKHPSDPKKFNSIEIKSRSCSTSYRVFSLQYPFHADAHKRDTKNLIHVVINTLEAQDHICKRPKEGQPKRASVASLFGDSMASGPGDASTRSGNRTKMKTSYWFSCTSLNCRSPEKFPVDIYFFKILTAVR